MEKVFNLIAAVIVCLSASAQVQFGFKVGVDATNFWGKTDYPSQYVARYPMIVNHNLRLNYQAGLVMEYKFSPQFAIAPEVVFAAQGGKITNGNPALAIDQRTVTYTTNYINVPVMLKYYLSPTFSIDLGPQVGFNVYSKTQHRDSKDFTKGVDLGVGLGATYNLTEHVFIQTRYTMGMTKVFKGEDINAKNSNIQLAIGMKY